jgi:hypothetical protein
MLLILIVVLIIILLLFYVFVKSKIKEIATIKEQIHLLQNEKMK